MQFALQGSQVADWIGAVPNDDAEPMPMEFDGVVAASWLRVPVSAAAAAFNVKIASLLGVSEKSFCRKSLAMMSHGYPQGFQRKLWSL